jgi:hypothetical protein
VFLEFNQLMAGRMPVVISQRYATVRTADGILVAGAGRALEKVCPAIPLGRAPFRTGQW